MSSAARAAWPASSPLPWRDRSAERNRRRDPGCGQRPAAQPGRARCGPGFRRERRRGHRPRLGWRIGPCLDQACWLEVVESGQPGASVGFGSSHGASAARGESAERDHRPAEPRLEAGAAASVARELVAVTAHRLDPPETQLGQQPPTHRPQGSGPRPVSSGRTAPSAAGQQLAEIERLDLMAQTRRPHDQPTGANVTGHQQREVSRA